MDDMVLPAGVHVAELAGIDIMTQEELTRLVIWADRPTGTCRHCQEPIPRVVEDCPVLFDSGAAPDGAIEPLDQKHRCGEWLTVNWRELDENDDLSCAAAELAAQLAAEIEAERDEVRSGLRLELAYALERLAEPLEEDETREQRHDEVRTGSETSPGVDQENGRWMAWDEDPDPGETEPIIVRPEDL